MVLVFLNHFDTDIKNNFLKVKNNILIYFRIKNTLKNNYNYISKQILKL
jgi:hypothetical protein